METQNLPAMGKDGGREEIRMKHLAPLDSLYDRVKRCEAETVSQALNLYFSELETFGLPESVAAGYVEVETLVAVSRILLDGGCVESEVLPRLCCPRFDLRADGLARACEWSFCALKRALEFRGRYNGVGGNPNIARARFYIEQHYMDPELMLKDAAAEARMSASRFSTVFAREIGRTFTEYVTDLRIKRAGELLVSTPMRISQIAVRVGYNDPHYFSWIFRKSTGQTPTGFRESGEIDGGD